jgi:AGZA family xanthine/uracil permease-like MFS transporter
MPGGTWRPPDLLPWLDWKRVLPAALAQLPIALPFALATVVGGIDCTESAAAAGDEYDTRTILLTEGTASILAGFMGGVIQTTPYIGHPAYKTMGGRAAYTISTALFVGAVGYFGWFSHFFEWLPRAAMFPILVFVGLEITAQSFRATPTRHYAALAIAVLPALAYLATIEVKAVLAGRPAPVHWETAWLTLRCLANGFIITSLLWAAALAALLDGRYRKAAAYLAVAGVFALFGIIHSPLLDAPIDWPGNVVGELEKLYGGAAYGASTVGLGTSPLGTGPFSIAAALVTQGGEARGVAVFQTPYHWATSYWLAAALLLGLSVFRTKAPPEPEASGYKH